MPCFLAHDLAEGELAGAALTDALISEADPAHFPPK